jgi:Flp pilus assembly secretin CpaC
VIPLLVVRGPNGFTPAEAPISSPEDREMTRRLQEVTGISTVYVIRTAENGTAIYGTVRTRAEFDRVQRYKVVIPVNKAGGAGANDSIQTVSPTHGYQSPANVQIFVRIEDPNEAALRLVTIDSNVVEISRNALKNLGVEFGSAQVISESTAAGATTREINPTFTPGTIQAGNGFGGTGGFGIIDAFRARLNALYTNGNANILSKPNVTTLEGTEAQITIGGSRPIPQVTSSGGGSGTVQENIIFRRFGVILTMRPTLLSDNTIILQVRVDVTDLDPATGITRGNTFIPGETVRSVNNVLVLKEGDIIALGGLITNSKRRQTSRVPVLSQIPILGSLFQSRRFENNESELAIFLTPSIKRVSVSGDGTEVGAVHPTGWPKLSGIDDNQGLNIGTTTSGSGSGGGQ